MSDKHNSLEEYLVANFKELDPTAHRVAGSGCTDYQKGDISNKFCAVEAKIKRSNKNIVIDYEHEWLKTLDQMPINSKKFVIVATENSFGEKFITMSAEDFFKLLKEAKC